MKLLKLVGAIALVIIGLAVSRYLITSQPLRFGANQAPQQQGWSTILYGYAVTVLGVLLGTIYRGLQKQKTTGTYSVGEPKKFMAEMLLSVDLWMSLCASPIVYALVWKSLEGGNAGGLTIIALQNGFCCQTVLGSLLTPGGAAQPPANGGTSNLAPIPSGQAGPG